jgi:hypothetical protein
MRRARLVALLIGLLAALVGPAQAATHRVVMHLGFTYKPHEFAVSGDGDFLVKGLSWRSWGGSTPSAHTCSTHGMPLAVRAITAHDSTCGTARTVVKDWFQRLKAPGGNHCIVPDGSARPAVCMVGSWRCTTVHTVNGQTYPVTCTARRRRVHFVNRV